LAIPTDGFPLFTLAHQKVRIAAKDYSKRMERPPIAYAGSLFSPNCAFKGTMECSKAGEIISEFIHFKVFWITAKEIQKFFAIAGLGVCMGDLPGLLNSRVKNFRRK